MRTIFSMKPLQIYDLSQYPEQVLNGHLNGINYQANIVIPYFKENIQSSYQNIIPSGYNQRLNKKLPPDFLHFGLRVEFSEPLELYSYDSEKNILGNVKDLVKQFGVIILKNIYFNKKQREEGHENRFPHLHFHRDRNETQTTPYSLFCRNPFDPIQKKPRTSSTLFTTYRIACLQSFKETKQPLSNNRIIAPHYDIFKEEETQRKMGTLFNNIILEHTWTAPEGVGEVTIMDNRTLLHASYYRQTEKGYRIGVRYLK